MTPFVCAGAGFLLAVLWFDLMFDVQVVGLDQPQSQEAVLASISSYYRRVTTAARPMNRLVGAVMLATIGSIVAQVARADRPRWAAFVSLALAIAPILLAAVRTVPRAVRLGARRDPLQRQGELAASIYRDHLLCVTAIGALLTVELAFG